MEIYHTETQADYDALMVELEAEGYKWRGTVDKPTQWNGWKLTGKETSVRLKGDFITQGSIADYKSIYEQTPIIKYKAKADEKMRFTKENIYKLFIKYRKAGNYTLNDLQDEILNLDDTPEKVVVPKFVAEWIESFTDITSSYSILEAFMCSYNKIVLPSELYNYYDNNENGARDKVISAILSGYEVENEPLYHVATKDGKLMLFKYENVVSVTPAPVVMTIKDYGHKPYYQLTESEIKSYDDRYWSFAVPVTELEESK